MNNKLFYEFNVDNDNKCKLLINFFHKKFEFDFTLYFPISIEHYDDFDDFISQHYFVLECFDNDKNESKKYIEYLNLFESLVWKIDINCNYIYIFNLNLFQELNGLYERNKDEIKLLFLDLNDYIYKIIKNYYIDYNLEHIWDY